MSGTMLERWDNSRLRQPLPKGNDMPGHLLWIRAEAAPQLTDTWAEWIHIDIGHRGQIQVDAKASQLPPQLLPLHTACMDAFLSHALSGRQIHKALLRLETTYLPPFLIHGYEHGARRSCTHVSRQPTDLFR